MRLKRLSLQNFRNYVRLDEDLPAGTIVLVGANAQGKTNLLEAVYYLATFASFHARHDRELVNFDAQQWGYPAVARIVAEFQREGEARSRVMEVRLILEANGNGGVRLRREVLLDGLKKKLTEALGVFNAVLFLPQMTQIVTGAPELRRRYLNQALSQVEPAYARTLAEYNQTLTRRNALLKLLNEQGGDPAQLDFWDEKIAQLGAVLISHRAKALYEWERFARVVHWKLTRKQENLRLRYVPAYNPLAGQLLQPDNATLARFSEDALREGLREALLRQRGEAIARGVTTIGPHRDDFRFLDGKLDLGVYGSRGQVRTVMLSLKMAEAEWLEARTGRKPVLLLDEMLAELDQARRSDLQAHLAQSEQVLLTTTDMSLFDPAFIQQSTVWHLEQGRIVPPDQA
ncbi:MAG: DNA replication/repair protein RecF [Chloroflexi bacterium]|nr:DNA replication/repair protein RecF [Chloroflexota bacterium]